MENTIEERMEAVDILSKSDDRYYAMLKAIRRLEPKFDSVLRLLEYDQRDVVSDYLMLCEEMSRRKLEIACIYMRFPHEKSPQG